MANFEEMNAMDYENVESEVSATTPVVVQGELVQQVPQSGTEDAVAGAIVLAAGAAAVAGATYVGKKYLLPRFRKWKAEHAARKELKGLDVETLKKLKALADAKTEAEEHVAQIEQEKPAEKPAEETKETVQETEKK